MLISQTIILSSLLFAFYILLYLPVGFLILHLFKRTFGVELSLMMSMAVSTACYVLTLPLCIGIGLSNQTLQLAYLSIVTLSSLCIAHRRILSLETLRKFAPGFFLVFLYYTLVCFSSAYPEGAYKDVVPESANNVSGYPIDNLISYNSSRYFVERIDPRSIEVVPTWQFADRGPVAGMLNAIVFISLGIKETSHWLSASRGTYFVYQTHLTFLNVSALFALWYFTSRRWGTRVAGYGVLLAGTTSFIFLNTLFSWPKLFMSYFAIMGFEFIGRVLRADGKLEWRDLAWIGVLFALGVATHEMLLLYFVPFLLIFTVFCLFTPSAFPRFPMGKLLPPFICLATFLSLLSPWLMFKQRFSTSESRLLHLHLFCVTDLRIEHRELYQALIDYVSREGMLNIIAWRIYNLVYPFDVRQIYPLVEGRNVNLYWWARASAALAPYHYIFAVGLPMFVCTLVGVWKFFRVSTERKNLALLGISLSALIPASLLFGCTPTLNHQWVYPFFLLSVIPAAYVCAIGWGWIILAGVVSWNTLVLVFEVWFRDESSIYLGSSHTFLLVQSLLFLVFIFVGFLGRKNA